MRPLDYMGVAPPERKGKRRKKWAPQWTVRERALSEALLEYEKSLNAHGTPVWISHDPDREWDTDETIDFQESVFGKTMKSYEDNDVKVDPGLRLLITEKVSEVPAEPSEPSQR